MRAPTQRRKPRKVQAVNFVAPVGGWIANRALAIGRDPKLPPGAAVLDDFFPTSTGILLRRGSELRYSIGANPVLSLFRYVSGNQQQLFASVNGPIEDVSGATSSQVYAGGTNGDWHVQQFTTSGGTFLIGVNGTDEPWIYDGSTFELISTFGGGLTFPVSSSATTNDLAYVWSYANRLWFIEKDSMSAWYLPVDEVVGELTELPLGGVFTMGGALLWGQTWSLASGGAGGLSDQCVFVSTEGEVLAYQGINPGDASFEKVGTYRIGEPMGRKGFVRAGGDLIIATSVGFISLGEASKRDFAALGSVATSYPIEEVWTEAVSIRGMTDWRCLVWPEGKMVLVAPPRGPNDEKITMVANSNTGAWCRFREWDIASMQVHNGQMHFGDREGNLWVGNVTGGDNEMPYTGTFIPLFEDLGSPASRKIARNGRVIKRSQFASNEQLSAKFDFDTEPPISPSTSDTTEGSVWGVGVWGDSVWGQDRGLIVTGNWKSLGGSGQDVSVCLQVTSNSVAPIDVEVIRIDCTFETADIIS